MQADAGQPCTPASAVKEKRKEPAVEDEVPGNGCGGQRPKAWTDQARQSRHPHAMRQDRRELLASGDVEIVGAAAPVFHEPRPRKGSMQDISPPKLQKTPILAVRAPCVLHQPDLPAALDNPDTEFDILDTGFTEASVVAALGRKDIVRHRTKAAPERRSVALPVPVNPMMSKIGIQRGKPARAGPIIVASESCDCLARDNRCLEPAERLWPDRDVRIHEGNYRGTGLGCAGVPPNGGPLLRLVVGDHANTCGAGDLNRIVRRAVVEQYDLVGLALGLKQRG